MEATTEIKKETEQNTENKARKPAAAGGPTAKPDEGDLETEPEIANTQLIGLIGDTDSVVGFLLGGIGEKTAQSPGETNVFIVDAETEDSAIEESLRSMLRRADIGMVFITRLVADRIRHFLSHRKKVYPIILEMPSALDPFEEGDEGEIGGCRVKKNIVKRKSK